ncbi:MAG: hypothetical protein WDN50_12940 [Bradyrhizobium sp.]
MNWLDHEIPIDNRRRRALYGFQHIGRYRPFAIARPAERIDDAAKHRRPHGNAHHIAGTAHHVACFDRIDIVQ